MPKEQKTTRKARKLSRFKLADVDPAAFCSMTDEAAEEFLYRVVLPQLEEQNLLISPSGLHHKLKPGTVTSEATYKNLKNQKWLYELDRLKSAVHSINEGSGGRPVTNKPLMSYALKHRFEDANKEYISNGTCMIAYLLAGYEIKNSPSRAPNGYVYVDLKSRVV